VYSSRHEKGGSIVLRTLSLLMVSLSLLFSACSVSHPQSGPSRSAKNPVSSSPSPSPSPTATSLLRPDLERGIAYPGWHRYSYGAADTTWRQGIQTIKTQTGSTWLEMPVLFVQSRPYSTNVWAGPNAPTLGAFAGGIRAAHALGYRVFFVPLIIVNVPDGWSGIIEFSTEQQEQAWFDSYWNALSPYALVAQENGAEQMAIGTELQWMDQYAPASLWNQLITRVRSVFTGILTYDMNWPTLYLPPQSWMKNPGLTMIGVSVYISLVDSPTWVDPKAMPGLWQDRIRKYIEKLSAQLGKRILITEIGYRDTSDGTYDTWNRVSSEASDPGEQAGAYDATLSNAFADPKIAGVFFWGWTNVGRLSIEGQSAVQVLHKWYTKTA
jgi:hypothetical protein